VNVSTTLPTTFQIRRGQLIAMLVATAALAAAVTWLLVAVAFDSGATPTPQTTSLGGALTPVAAVSSDAGGWPGSPPYPPDFRGMP
jgi:hypothetical protein